MNFTKPEVDEVYNLLKQQGALVVHFSGVKGDEVRPERWFPFDLKTIIDGKAAGGISCSTVTAMDSYETSWGSIGVIVGMESPQSLVGVHPRDCGSREDIVDGRNVRIVENERHLSIDDLRKSIVERDGYNEWVIRDFPVLGIFVQAPCMAEDASGAPRQFSLQELMQHFPGQPIFTFKDSKIIRLVPGPPEEVSHADIYR